MKITRTSEYRSFILEATLLVGLGFITPASADVSYLVDLNTNTVTKLGSLGGSNTVATALNDVAQVVGYSTTQTGPSTRSSPAPTGPGSPTSGFQAGSIVTRTASTMQAKLLGSRKHLIGLVHELSSRVLMGSE